MAFDSILRGKMEQILQAYGLPKETNKAFIMFAINTKVKVSVTGWKHRYLDIVGVLKGDIFTAYVFINLSRLFTSNVDRYY